MAKKYPHEEEIRLIDKVAAENIRFVNRLNDLRKILVKDERYYTYSLKERAAAKRASMDLSRILAVFRKPGHGG